MTTLQIRAAMEADAEEIARLHIRVWQQAYRGLIDDDYLDRLDQTLPRRVEWRRELLVETAPERRTWVATLDGRPVGFVDTCPSRDPDGDETTGEVAAIYVDQTTARRGIGRALMAHAVEDFRARGFRGATLWVISSNDRARRFYESVGWRFDGRERIESWLGLELHELRYRIELAQ